MSYTVNREPHGIVITGSVPITDLVTLCKAWEPEGFTIIDAGVASSLGASMVITSPEGSKAWRQEIAARNSHLDREARWLGGTDTGLSSQTIFRVLASERGRLTVAGVRDRPSDADDFGRCHRLLETMPGWRERLGEVAERFPEWRRLVDAWPELTALHVAKEWSKLTARMREVEAAR